MKTANIAHSIALIELQNLPDAVNINIREQIARLREEYQQIISCQVSVKVPVFQPEGCYQIEIILALPERHLKIERSPNPDCYQEDLTVSIWSAFHLVKQQLRHYIPVSAGVDRSVATRNVDRPWSISPSASLYPRRRCVGYAGG